MNKKTTIFIVIILAFLTVVLFLLFRPQEAEKKEPAYKFDPTDSAIYYETGAVHEEWGKYIFEIKKGGKSAFNRFKEMELEKTYVFEISEEELARILEVVAKNDFLSMRDEYTDPAIMDGGYELLKITYGNKEKTVRLNTVSYTHLTLPTN